MSIKRPLRGFTIIETLVAMFVLMFVLVGPLALASHAIDNALISKDQTIAFNLAQDAVEYVRFVRDTNKLSSATDWLTGLDGGGGGCAMALGCTVDSLQVNSARPCGVGGCSVLNYDATNHVFTYQLGPAIAPSAFTRVVRISCASGADCTTSTEASVQVSVSWRDVGTVVHSVTVQENMFNWQ